MCDETESPKKQGNCEFHIVGRRGEMEKLGPEFFEGTACSGSGVGAFLHLGNCGSSVALMHLTCLWGHCSLVNEHLTENAFQFELLEAPQFF